MYSCNIYGLCYLVKTIFTGHGYSRCRDCGSIWCARHCISVLPGRITNYLLCPCCEVHLHRMQLCGRAGRSGCQARAHLLYTTKKISDVVLQQYCASNNTENCLRDILLKGLDSCRVAQDHTVCCSVCSAGNVPYCRLDVLKGSSRQYRKRPTPVREISVSLKKKLEMELKLERNSIISEQPHIGIFGEQYVYMLQHCH